MSRFAREHKMRIGAEADRDWLRTKLEQVREAYEKTPEGGDAVEEMLIVVDAALEGEAIPERSCLRNGRTLDNNAINHHLDFEDSALARCDDCGTRWATRDLDDGVGPCCAGLYDAPDDIGTMGWRTAYQAALQRAYGAERERDEARTWARRMRRERDEARDEALRDHVAYVCATMARDEQREWVLRQKPSIRMFVRTLRNAIDGRERALKVVRALWQASGASEETADRVVDILRYEGERTNEGNTRVS